MLKGLAIVVVLIAVGVAVLTRSPVFQDEALGKKVMEGKLKMNAVITTKKGEIALQKVDVPKPAYGQLLVKMKYAPVNPSDIYLALKEYSVSGKDIEYPHMNGLEGSGVVVGTGGGVVGHAYVKLQMRCSLYAKHGGFSWAEYAVVDFDQCLPLPSSVSNLDGCAAVVNPLTVVGFLEMAKEAQHKAMVHTAANSALGIMLLKAAPKYNVKIIAVVRGEANEKALLDFGHPRELVLRSDVDDFPETLKKTVDKFHATFSMDAVGGTLSKIVYDAMPAKSDNYVYGMLSGVEPPKELFENKNKDKPFTYYLIKNWLDEGGPLRLIQSIISLYRLLPNELSTEFAHITDLTKSIPVLEAYSAHQKGGKNALKL